LGLKQAAIGNSFGEHIGNLMGTWKKHRRNMLRIKEKWKKSSLPPPNSKENKIKPLLVYDSPYQLHACISSFQSCWSLFFAWVNCTSRNWTRKKNKKLTPPPPPPHECMLSLLIGCIKSFFPTACYEGLTPLQPWIPAR
jgi:hypothetical protein